MLAAEPVAADEGHVCAMLLGLWRIRRTSSMWHNQLEFDVDLGLLATGVSAIDESL